MSRGLGDVYKRQVIGKNSTDEKFEFAKVGEDLQFLSTDEIENIIKKDLKNWFQN